MKFRSSASRENCAGDPGEREIIFRENIPHRNLRVVGEVRKPGGLRGWEFCPFSPFFANFSTFTKISQVPSFQAHSPVKTVFRQHPKNARKSQNPPSTNPYQNETQFPLSSLKNATSGHDRPPKSVLCPPVISGTNSRQNSLKFP